MVVVTVTDRFFVMDVRCRFVFTVCALLLMIARTDGSPFTDCVQSKGKAGFYEGSIDATESGVKCMNWSDVPGVTERYQGKGLGDHTFCRNPDGRIRPWCFFTNNRGRIDWGYCDCKQGMYMFTKNIKFATAIFYAREIYRASSVFHFLTRPTCTRITDFLKLL